MGKTNKSASPGTGDDSEPKENDKCIVNPDAAPGDNNGGLNEAAAEKFGRMDMLEDRMKRAKEFVSDRYHRIILVLGIVVFVLLIVVIVLAASLGSISYPSAAARCETSDCLRAAAHVVSGINDTFDPCTDFWSYSCKGWIKSHPIPDNKGSFSVFDAMSERINHELRHLLDLVPQRGSPSNPDWKAKKFYSSCMNEEDIEYSSVNALKTAVNNIGGWPILNSWSVSTFSRNVVLKRLQVNYGATPFFKVSVDTDDFVPNAAVIKIEPAGLGLPDRDFYYNSKYEKQTSAYRQFLRDVAKQFGAPPDMANKYSEDMYSYEKRLAEVTPSPEDLDDPQTVFKKIRIKDLHSVAPTIDWLDILQTFFPKGNIRDNTVVVVAFEEYFRKISNIISTTDNEALNNYMLTRFVSSYVSYLSRPFRVIANEFYQTMNGIEGNFQLSEERWEFCLRLTSEYVGLALGSMYVKNRQETHPNTIQEAHRIVDAVQSSLIENINSFNWLRTVDTEKARTKIRSLVLSLSHPEYITRPDLLKNYYNDLIVQSNFFSNIEAAVAFSRKVMERRLKAPTSPENSWPLIPQTVDAVYQYAGNRVTISSGLVQYPLFDPTLPMAMKFGAFGFIVGSKMLRALDPQGVKYDAIGGLATWLDTDSFDHLNQSMQCLTDEINDQSYANSFSISPILALSQTFADVGALKHVYEAYKRHAKSNGEENVLPGLSGNNDQLFFVSFAQSMCEAVRPGKATTFYETVTTLPSVVRVNIGLREVPQFAKSFGCSARGYSCDLW